MILVYEAQNRGHVNRCAKRSQAATLHRPGAIVVYESTVYPGCTEEVCLPMLEQASGLKAGRDFTVGYSPERINPGDAVHTLIPTTSPTKRNRNVRTLEHLKTSIPDQPDQPDKPNKPDRS